MSARALAESCLLQARCQGILPYWMDTQAMVRPATLIVSGWTEAQCDEAATWRERSLAPSEKASPPAHVATMVERLRRDYKVAS